jgi:two-component system, cell cycle response regulator DivK
MAQTHAVIIDDNAQNIKVLKQLLTKQGVSCTDIPDSRKILDVLPTLEQIDMVFLDLEMPGMDGYHAKDVLRANLGSTPIIAYTVHTSEINVVREMGFDGFLGKPLDNARFPDQLARILKGESVWDRG